MKLEAAISLIQTKYLMHGSPETWADLGTGSGLFTQALSTLLADQSVIYAIDKNLSSFNLNTSSERVCIRQQQQDFEMDTMALVNLDGILMANSLHFIKNKPGFLERTKTWFRNKPVFLIVEYDRDDSNPWVPYPLSFRSLKELFTRLAFSDIKKIHEVKSLYGRGKMYSALIQ